VSWRSDLTKLRARTWGERGLLLDALLSLGLSRAGILVLPFRRVAALSGLARGESSTALSPEVVERAVRVGWAVEAAALRSPWKSTCLAQALAATLMLRRRGLPGTLHLGVARNQTGRGQIEAHAWVRCGEETLTGGSRHGRFTTISSFRFGPVPGQRPGVRADIVGNDRAPAPREVRR
jgi:hypothetical protein